jgi:ABC-type glycerol-3-phosphate transport system substrate-binding protein
VTLQVVIVPLNDMSTKLSTAIAGGEPPDAARVGGAGLNALFIDNHQAAALDQWDPKIGTYDWLKPLQQALSRDGKLYAMPVNSGALGLIYNKDRFQSSGLDPEKPPATLDQLMELAVKLAKPSDQVWGLYLLTAPTSQTGGDVFPGFLWAFGGKEVSPDGATVTFGSAEGVAALQWYQDLAQKNKVTPVKSLTETNMASDFLTGKVGVLVSYPTLLGAVEKASFKLGAARFPGATRQVPPLGLGTIMVLDKAKKKEAGWEFAKFVGLDAGNNAFWNTSFGQLPPRLSYRDDPTWKAYEKMHPLVVPYAESQSSADVPYYGPGSQEIATEVGKAIEAVVFGQKTPKQAIDEAAKNAQAILDRVRKKAG